MTRNQAKFFIRKGRTSVDGKIVTDPDFELSQTSEVCYDGKPINICQFKYIMLNKPISYSCVSNDDKYPSVLNLLPDELRKYNFQFVNILEPNYSGLVLVSDDIRWSSRIYKKVQMKKFIYEVSLNECFDEHIVEQIEEAYLSSSNRVDDEKIEIEKNSENSFILKISINQLHEMIRVFSNINLEIKNLKLNQIGRLCLGNVEKGEYIELSEKISI